MIVLTNNQIHIKTTTELLAMFRINSAYLADGHERDTRFINETWDGYKYICDYKGTLLGGHLPTVLQVFSNDLIKDTRKVLPTIEFWDDSFKGIYGKYTPTVFQKNAYLSMVGYIDNGLIYPRGILDMATNAGKSLVMAMAVNTLLQFSPNIKILFLFQQTELLDQLSELFIELNIQHNLLLSEVEMKRRKVKVNESGVLFAMGRTLYNNLEKYEDYLESCDCVMVDECHLFGADEMNKVLTMCNAWGRWGFSGTPFSGKTVEQQNIIMGQFGSILYTVTNQQLIEAGISAKPTISIIEYDLFGNYYDYQGALKAIINSAERNNIAYKWIKKNPHKRYLVIVEQKEHIEKLEALLQEFEPLPYHADLSSKTRKEYLRAFKEKECNVLIANGTAKHGLNVKDINVIIYLRGGKSPVWVNQIVGRGLRLKTTGEQEFDFVDVYDNKHMLRPHSEERLELYRSEGYTIKTLKDYEI